MTADVILVNGRFATLDPANPDPQAATRPAIRPACCSAPVGGAAIVGALLLPRLRLWLDADGLMLAAAAGTALVMAAVAFSPPQWLAVVLLLVLGVAWIIRADDTEQHRPGDPPELGARAGLAVYLTVFNGALTGGSLAWGLVAERAGASATLLISAAALAAVSLALYRLKLPLGEADLVPSNHWPEPLTTAPVEHDRGPVTILIEYRIRAAFQRAVTLLSEVSRRDGAYAWGIAEDAADPELIVEWFMVESWAEHLRHQVQQFRLSIGRSERI